jgi:hypothetical protein
MARKRIDLSIDPATRKPLPDGVTYRGPGQYRARKLVDGRRFTKTFTTARIAARCHLDDRRAHRRGARADDPQNVVARDHDSEKRGAGKERGHLKVPGWATARCFRCRSTMFIR